MERRSLVKLAAGLLPPRATLAVYPDHPLVLRPPEILGSRRGALYAVFVVQSTEVVGRGRHTFGRYLLNRLALADNAVFVAAVEDPADVDAIPPGLFDAVIPVTYRPSRIADHPLGAEWQQAVEALRPAHLERFSVTWSLDNSLRQERVRRHSAKDTTAGLSMARRKVEQERATYVSFTSNRHLTLDAPEQLSRQQQLALISSAALMAVEADYGLTPARTTADTVRDTMRYALSEPEESQALPQRRRSHLHLKPPTDLVTHYGQLLNHGDAVLALHRAFVPIPSTSRAFDIEKPLRAAAFAGYMPETRSEIEGNRSEL